MLGTLGINEMGGGAAFFDMDNDGDEDLWISGGINRDVLYENDGSGYFKEVGVQAGLTITTNMVTTGVVTGDVDNDSYSDVLLLTHRGFHNTLLRNKGDGTFQDVTTSAGLEDESAYTLAAAMGDVNLDGYLDIYIANYIKKHVLLYDMTEDTVQGFDHTCHANRLYINNGDWTFTEVAEEQGVSDKGCGLAVAFSDYDGDNDADILVANDFGSWVLPNALYKNQFPEDGYEDVGKFSGMDVQIYGMGIAIGDYDMDLDLDYYITNIGKNVLLQNMGNGIFTDQAVQAGVPDTYVDEGLFTTGWGTAFMDFDNDTDLDLYVVNGFVPAAPFISNALHNPNRLFENDGDMDFLLVNVNRQGTSIAIQRNFFSNKND